MPTHGDMIDEISRELSEPFTREQLIEAIVEKYGHVRSINIQSLGTDIAGCCVNLKSHRSLPGLPLFLVSLGRGKFRRYNPSTDQRLNLYNKQDTGELKIVKRPDPTNRKKGRSISTMATFYDYNGAEAILEKRGLMEEIRQIINDIWKVDHDHIQDLFASRGWSVEYRIHPNVNWAWDAHKKRIPVSIELSLIDAVHRDFLRLLLWEYEDKVDAMVYITSTFKEPKFENVKRDLDIFEPILKVPILHIGLSSM
jgi:hypothetical protein